MAIKFSKKLKKEFSKKNNPLKTFKPNINSLVSSNGDDEHASPSFWHYIYPFVVFAVVLIACFLALFNLQVIEYENLSQRAKQNQFEIEEVKPNRGIIVDRNGKKLAQNTPSISVFYNSELFLDDKKLQRVSDIVQGLVKDEWKGSSKTSSFASVYQRAKAIWENMSENDRSWVRKVEVLSGLSNEAGIKIKAESENIPLVYVENGSKRIYPYKDVMSHIVGYTGSVFAEDLEELEYISFNDVIGKTGVEKVYDELLFGKKGRISRERDSKGEVVEEGSMVIQEPISGDTLMLSIDAVAQKKMYEILKSGVSRFRADGGAAIIENISNGELLVLASYPSYDNNLFVSGISQKQYDSIIKKSKNPFLNRAIAAEVPPGSTFKTIVAASALDAKAITKDTIYVSRRGFTFSDGSPFQEFNNNAYGSLNLFNAISVSSNIYFCETILHWDIDKLVVYLDKFGIGKQTGIDLIGEGTGRLPSPKNKILLAKTTSPWLDPVWYPEGDACNSVIGQGITTVTPIQMVNWISAIANGGTLLAPHLAMKTIDYKGKETQLAWPPLQNKVAKDSALSLVREGMWGSVNGPRRVIAPLTDAKVTVAAKTGTAEFGRVNAQGQYEHTHAWVTGFFPYEKPKYAFVIFLEDGGASNNAAQLAREFIDWFSAK